MKLRRLDPDDPETIHPACGVIEQRAGHRRNRSDGRQDRNTRLRADCDRAMLMQVPYHLSHATAGFPGL
jgi:hypothetical protein